MPASTNDGRFYLILQIISKTENIILVRFWQLFIKIEKEKRWIWTPHCKICENHKFQQDYKTLVDINFQILNLMHENTIEKAEQRKIGWLHSGPLQAAGRFMSFFFRKKNGYFMGQPIHPSELFQKNLFKKSVSYCAEHTKKSSSSWYTQDASIQMKKYIGLFRGFFTAYIRYLKKRRVNVENLNEALPRDEKSNTPEWSKYHQQCMLLVIDALLAITRQPTQGCNGAPYFFTVASTCYKYIHQKEFHGSWEFRERRRSGINQRT